MTNLRTSTLCYFIPLMGTVFDVVNKDIVFDVFNGDITFLNSVCDHCCACPSFVF